MWECDFGRRIQLWRGLCGSRAESVLTVCFFVTMYSLPYSKDDKNVLKKLNFICFLRLYMRMFNPDSGTMTGSVWGEIHELDIVSSHSILMLELVASCLLLHEGEPQSFSLLWTTVGD